MIKVYGYITPNVLKVLMAAEEVKVGYEHINVNLFDGEQHKPAHVARHPFGMVPVIEHEGRFLYESNAIVRYVANITDSSLYPKANWERGLVDQWMDYASQHIGRYTLGVFYQRVVRPLFNEKADEPKVAEFTTLFNSQLPIVEKHLERNRYLVGDDFSIADIVLFSTMAIYNKTGLDFSQAPAFKKWVATVQTRDSVESLLKTFELPWLR